ncbi:MAG TPA: hypothetical protein VJR06_04185, partial [Nitrososphaerales archaeon]|nr:hypothetical protein [Nitrososphaerales archaeon]
GLVNGPHSANNYKVILGYLEELIDQIDHQDFKNYEHHIHWLYNTGGEMPRVQTKISLDFKRLSGRYEGILPDPDAHTASDLRKLLVEEREKYKKQYEVFKPYWPRITEEERERARDLETLSEEREDDLERLEWEASLKRQEYLRRAIDRKLRTVIAIQREARLQEAHAARMADRASNTGVPPVEHVPPSPPAPLPRRGEGRRDRGDGGQDARAPRESPNGADQQSPGHRPGSGNSRSGRRALKGRHKNSVSRRAGCPRSRGIEKRRNEPKKWFRISKS